MAVRSSVAAAPTVGALMRENLKRPIKEPNASGTSDLPIGSQLLLQGLCSRDELCAALRLQMSMRFERMFAERSVSGYFDAGGVAETPEFDPETFASLCMRTARRMRLGAACWPSAPMSVSFVGRQLLDSFALAPAERACLEVCARRPMTEQQIRSVLGDATMVADAISALHWLGAFERTRRGHGSYLSLLQERRRARLREPLTAISSEERRRRIGAAHPDRFASDPSVAIKEASEEALRALVRKR